MCVQSSLNQRLELERQRRRVAEDTITALQSKTVSSNQDMEADLEEGFTPSAYVVHAHGSVPCMRFCTNMSWHMVTVLQVDCVHTCFNSAVTAFSVVFYLDVLESTSHLNNSDFTICAMLQAPQAASGLECDSYYTDRGIKQEPDCCSSSGHCGSVLPSLRALLGRESIRAPAVLCVSCASASMGTVYSVISYASA